MNASYRPVPQEILAAVASGDMPMLVFADYAEDICGNSHDADLLRALAADDTPRDWGEIRYALVDAEIGQAVSHALSRQFKARLWKEHEDRVARDARATMEAFNRSPTLRQLAAEAWRGITAVSARVWRW
jgi:hypothetical protein